MSTFKIAHTCEMAANYLKLSIDNALKVFTGYHFRFKHEHWPMQDLHPHLHWRVSMGNAGI